MHDVQTLAMLSCVFQLHCNQFSLSQANSSSTVTSSSFPRCSPVTQSPSTARHAGPHLSSSWHDVRSDFPHPTSTGANGVTLGSVEDDERVQEEKTHRHNCFLLDKLLVRHGDEYRRCYANILYQWQLLEQRAEVVKLQSSSNEDHTKIGEWLKRASSLDGQCLCCFPKGFINYCRTCGEQVDGPDCKLSHCFAFHCNICNLSVRGE